MPDMIRDGTGKGYLAQVTSKNELVVIATSYSGEHHINHSDQKAFQLLFDVTPTGAGDCFLYIKNTATDDLIVEGVNFRVASAEQVQTYLGVTGTPSGGSSATPVNCTAGSATAATGTFETGNDITGLSGGRVVEKLWLTSTSTEHFNYEQDIIIPINQTFALYAVTGGVNVSGTVVFNYHALET